MDYVHMNPMDLRPLGSIFLIVYMATMLFIVLQFEIMLLRYYGAGQMMKDCCKKVKEFLAGPICGFDYEQPSIGILNIIYEIMFALVFFIFLLSVVYFFMNLMLDILYFLLHIVFG